MRALYVERNAITAELKDVPVPTCGPYDALINVKSAILGPEVMRFIESGQLSQTPTIPGHKVAGVIAEVGSSITGIKVGQRIRLDPNLNCRECFYCRTERDHLCSECGIIGFFALRNFPQWEKFHRGGLAEYVCVPASQVDVLPEAVSFDTGAKVHDLANAVHALRQCNLRPGSTLLITAATGAMGTACVKLAPVFGVVRLILVGRSTERLHEVTKLTSLQCECVGLDKLSQDWASKRELGSRVQEVIPEGVDAVVDYSAEGTDLYQVIDAMVPGGTFIVMGGNRSVVPVPARLLGLNCWRVVGVRNHSRADSSMVLNLLQNGRLQADDLKSHEFSLENIDAALEQLKNRSQPSWMIVIRP